MTTTSNLVQYYLAFILLAVCSHTLVVANWPLLETVATLVPLALGIAALRLPIGFGRFLVALPLFTFGTCSLILRDWPLDLAILVLLTFVLACSALHNPLANRRAALVGGAM